MRRPAPHAKLDWYPDPASGIHDAPSRMGVGGFLRLDLGARRGRWRGGGGGGGEKDKSGKRVLAANLPRLEYIATGMAERNIVPRRKPQP